MFAPSILQLFIDLGIPNPCPGIGLHLQAYPPYGAFNFVEISMKQDPLDDYLIFFEGMPRPAAPEHLKRLGAKTRFDNESVESMCIEALAASEFQNGCLLSDVRRGEDPPDYYVNMGGSDVSLEMTSLALEVDRQVEAALDRTRTLCLQRATTHPHLQRTYISLDLARQARLRGARMENETGRKSIEALLRFLGSEELKRHANTLRESQESISVPDSSLAIRLNHAGVPFRSRFYDRFGFDFVNGLALRVEARALVNLLAKKVLDKDKAGTVAVCVTIGMPDKQGMLFPRETALKTLLLPAIRNCGISPQHIRYMILQEFPRHAHVFEFTQSSWRLKGTYDDKRPDIPPPGLRSGKYEVTANFPFFAGTGRMSGGSPENQ